MKSLVLASVNKIGGGYYPLPWVTGVFGVGGGADLGENSGVGRVLAENSKIIEKQHVKLVGLSGVACIVVASITKIDIFQCFDVICRITASFATWYRAVSSRSYRAAALKVAQRRGPAPRRGVGLQSSGRLPCERLGGNGNQFAPLNILKDMDLFGETEKGCPGVGGGGRGSGVFKAAFSAIFALSDFREILGRGASGSIAFVRRNSSTLWVRGCSVNG